MTLVDRLILGAIICILVGLIAFGCYTLISEENACRQRGGAYVKGFMTYACVERH